MYAMLRRAMLVVWRFGKITLAQYFQHNAESNHFRRTPFSNFLRFRYEIYYSRSFSRAIESLSVLSVRKRRIPNNALVHGHLNECVCFNWFYLCIIQGKPCQIRDWTRHREECFPMTWPDIKNSVIVSVVDTNENIRLCWKMMIEIKSILLKWNQSSLSIVFYIWFYLLVKLNFIIDFLK